MIDIIYRNIKHAFFQPSNRHSSLIIVHFRLHSPIMINKAAHKDVQFYLEIEDGESLLDNKRRNQYDKDEIEDEERQRRVLAKLDKEFKNFCDKVSRQLCHPHCLCDCSWICVYLCVYTQMHAHTHTHVHEMHKCTHPCMRCTRTRRHIHTNAHITHTHTHTHTHTGTPATAIGEQERP